MSEFLNDGLLKTNLRKQTSGLSPNANIKDHIETDMENPGAEAMARQREDLSNQAAVAAKELEKLRQRQRELEREKETIEKIARRQESYEDGKREMISKLSHALVSIRKEQEEVSKTAELLEATRIRFEKALEEIKSINEEKWPENEFAVKVEEALAVVEGARSTYEKCQARLDAVSWLRQNAKLSQGAASPVDRLAERMQRRPGFLYWLMVGVAVVLPLAFVLSFMYFLLLKFIPPR